MEPVIGGIHSALSMYGDVDDDEDYVTDPYAAATPPSPASQRPYTHASAHVVETDGMPCFWRPPETRLRILLVCVDYQGRRQQELMEREVDIVERFQTRLNRVRVGYVSCNVLKGATFDDLLQANGSTTYDIVHVIAHAEKESFLMKKPGSGPNQALVGRVHNRQLPLAERLEAARELNHFSDVQVLEWWQSYLSNVASPQGALLLLQGCGTRNLGEAVLHRYRALSATTDNLAERPALIFAHTFYDILYNHLVRAGQNVDLRLVYNGAAAAAAKEKHGYPGVFLEGFEPDAALIDSRQRWLRVSHVVFNVVTTTLRNQIAELFLRAGFDPTNGDLLKQLLLYHAAKMLNPCLCSRCCLPKSYAGHSVVIREEPPGESLRDIASWSLETIFLAFDALRTHATVRECKDWDLTGFQLLRLASKAQGISQMDASEFQSCMRELTAMRLGIVVEIKEYERVISEMLCDVYQHRWRKISALSIPWHHRSDVSLEYAHWATFLLFFLGGAALLLQFGFWFTVYRAIVTVPPQHVINACVSTNSFGMQSFCSDSATCAATLSLLYTVKSTWTYLDPFTSVCAILGSSYALIAMSCCCFSRNDRNGLQTEMWKQRQNDLQSQVVHPRTLLFVQPLKFLLMSIAILGVFLCALAIVGLAIWFAIDMSSMTELALFASAGMVTYLDDSNGNAMNALRHCMSVNETDSWVSLREAPNGILVNLSVRSKTWDSGLQNAVQVS